jgi:hypothetical protein
MGLRLESEHFCWVEFQCLKLIVLAHCLLDLRYCLSLAVLIGDCCVYGYDYVRTQHMH